MRALEEQSRRTNEEIQDVRAEVKMQGTELYNKIEQLQLKMETLLSTMSSFEANYDSEREMRENVVGIQESNRGGYNINYLTLWGGILVVG
jgi:DNA repair exonuclease SbcCD ATPase subunit